MTRSVNGKERSIAGDEAGITSALGSDRQDEAEVLAPLDMSGLRSLAGRFDKRLRSTGGRPTDPDWTLSRRVPLKVDTWESLNRIAAALDELGTKVAPAQVASLLLEDKLGQLNDLDEAAIKTYEDNLRRKIGRT